MSAATIDARMKVAAGVWGIDLYFVGDEVRGWRGYVSGLGMA